MVESLKVGVRERVRMEQVCKAYGEKEARLEVLREVDLSIREGEFLGIVGASGSGKSTLMNLIGCLDRPSRGRYLLDGEDISTVGDDDLSAIRNRRIGFVFQSFNLIPELNVVENVEVPLFYMKTPKHKRKDRCLALLERVGLSHRPGHYPTQLSGGECQRVAIARALVNDPAIVLADEPTGNLDTKSGEEILNVFHELHGQGCTLIMVTHNMEVAAQLSRIVEISDGRIISDLKNGDRKISDPGHRKEGG